MSQQPQQGPPAMLPPQVYAPQEVPQGAGAESRGLEEASSTDCSELSGHPESSSSTSGGEETIVPEGGEPEERSVRGQGDAVLDHKPASPSSRVTADRDADVSTRGSLVEEEAVERTATGEDITLVTESETREMWTQSPPEVAVQATENDPATQPPHSPASLTPHDVLEMSSPAVDGDDILADSSVKERPEIEQPDTPVTMLENRKSVAEEKPQPTQRPSRRRNGRGRNNKMSVPVIQSEEPPADEPKPSTPPPSDVLPRDEVEVLQTEEPEPVLFIPETPNIEEQPSHASAELIVGPQAEPPAASVDSAPVEEKVVISNAAPAPVQHVPAKAQTAPELSEEKEQEVLEITLKAANEALPLVEEKLPQPETSKPTDDRHTPVPTKPPSPELEINPDNTLPLDTFTFKPEPYKHPMLKSTMKDIKDDPSLITELLNRDRNGDVSKDHEEEMTEKKIRESSPPSGHLEDLPRRKARLKKPPEREQTPEMPMDDVPVGEEHNTEILDVNPLVTFGKGASSAVTKTPDNNQEGEKKQRSVTPEQQRVFPDQQSVLLEQKPVQAEQKLVSPVQKPEQRPVTPEHQPVTVRSSVVEESISKEETLTEVVSKWLEENSDALPESLEEVKGAEMKTETVSAVEEAEGEEKLTGSKNGVRNPFPAPSNRLPKPECVCACVSESVRACESNESACTFSKDGPVKRVANRIFGTGDDETKTEVETKVVRKEIQDGEGVAADGSNGGAVLGERGNAGTRVEGGTYADEDDDQRSCEWEPMTVEASRRNFADLESWKRYRGGLGGSAEALRSLGSYRGTDDEEEEEARKARINMCDPTSSVAKYYCLGAARETKSPSPQEVVASAAVAPAPTDSGVQTDEEDDVFSVVTAEEAKEEFPATGQRKPRLHKPVGLGRTAAFVARQIGATDSAKGPFPCGICCIIQ